MERQTKMMVLSGVFTALTAIGAFIRIPLPLIPIVLQVFFVLMAGMLLGPKWGMISQLTYVVIGLVGVPIFTAGGGFGYVLQPTFGYLIGFIPAAYVVGLLVERQKEKSFWSLFGAALVGVAIYYLIGVPYLAIISKLILGKTNAVWTAVSTGFLITLPGDMLKAAAAALLSLKLLPALRK